MTSAEPALEIEERTVFILKGVQFDSREKAEQEKHRIITAWRAKELARASGLSARASGLDPVVRALTALLEARRIVYVSKEQRAELVRHLIGLEGSLSIEVEGLKNDVLSGVIINVVGEWDEMRTPEESQETP